MSVQEVIWVFLFLMWVKSVKVKFVKGGKVCEEFNLKGKINV